MQRPPGMADNSLFGETAAFREKAGSVSTPEPFSKSIMLHGKRITVAATGGIALYKVCEVVRGLVRLGADVRVAMTENAARFVSPTTFEALSGHPVHLTEWLPGAEGAMPHIELTRGADLLLVAPATANTLAKAAMGIADNLVSSLIAAHRCPTVFVPAMNVNMWRNPANQRNVAMLRKAGFHFIGPDHGFQACGDTGAGRMTEPAGILDLVPDLFEEKLLKGRRVVVTAGPTYEAIDAVRGLTNRSSGLQGFSIARAARAAGAEVTLVAGPVRLGGPEGVRRIDVVSARDMLEAVRRVCEEAPADLFIGVAAVADWRPEAVEAGKIKKHPGEGPTIGAVRWVENPDILASVAAFPNAPLTIGFAAECDGIEAYAREKCRRKGAAFIVANDARMALDSDRNRVLIVSEEGTEAVGPSGKLEIARHIVARAAEALAGRGH